MVYPMVYPMVIVPIGPNKNPRGVSNGGMTSWLTQWHNQCPPIFGDSLYLSLVFQSIAMICHALPCFKFDFKTCKPTEPEAMAGARGMPRAPTTCWAAPGCSPAPLRRPKTTCATEGLPEQGDFGWVCLVDCFTAGIC